MRDDLVRAADWISGAGTITLLTGAGISAESGVPTFRGKGGLWRKHRPEELATPGAYARNPLLVWEWYRYRQKLIGKADPNPGHYAIARLEEKKDSFTLITQNVDGLHWRAGSRSLVEVHGNIFRARCPVDGRTVMLTGDEEETIPRCSCGSPMRPDVVWFGEALPEEAIRIAHESSIRADLFLVVGTSALVYPAASFPILAGENGARLIEINPEETQLSRLADLSFRAGAAVILPEIVRLAFPPQAGEL